jgi:hypothetical protein
MAKKFFVIAILLLLPALAKADSVWTHQGNSDADYDHLCGCGVGEGFILTGTVLLNNNDQAIAWDFIAGPDIFTNFNSTGTLNPFASSGSHTPFVFWNFLEYSTSNSDG